ncbi:amino acid ABC transporter permease [Nocardioides hungaricus]
MDNTDSADTSANAPRVVPVRHYGRWISAVVLLGLVVWFVSAVAGNDNLDFAVVREYVFSGDIITGVGRTIRITITAMAIAMVLGVVIATMNLSRNPVAKTFALVYLWLLRGIPFLLTLVILYNIALVFPSLSLSIPGTSLTLAEWDTNEVVTPFLAAVLALAVTESAYYSEIVRGGILSVDQGQVEAAQAVGLSSFKTFRIVVLPQALRVIVPPTGNELIGMLKYSAFASVIGYSELTGNAQIISAGNARVVEMLLVAAFWYLVMTSILSVAQWFIERRVGRSSVRDSKRRRRPQPQPTPESRTVA